MRLLRIEIDKNIWNQSSIVALNTMHVFACYSLGRRKHAEIVLCIENLHRPEVKKTSYIPNQPPLLGFLISIWLYKNHRSLPTTERKQIPNIDTDIHKTQVLQIHSVV